MYGWLEQNACGSGYPAPEQLLFHVELRDVHGSLGWWRLPDAPIASGVLEEGRFRFEHHARVVAAPAQPERGLPGCSLDRVETIEGALHIRDASLADGGVPDGSRNEDASTAEAAGAQRLEGTTTVRVSAAAGSDCSSFVGAGTGQFPALPCELRFQLVGDRLDDELW